MSNTSGRKILDFFYDKNSLCIKTKYLEYKFTDIKKIKVDYFNNLYSGFKTIKLINDEEYYFYVNFNSCIIIVKNKFGVMDIFNANTKCLDFFQKIV